MAVIASKTVKRVVASSLHRTLEMSASGANASAYRRWRHDANRTFINSVIQTVHSFLMRSFSSSRLHPRSWYELEADISSIYCKHDVIYYTSLRFLKVVLAHISGKVGTLCTILLSVKCLFHNMFTNFHRNLFISTDAKQKNSWHFFSETRCSMYIMNSRAVKTMCWRAAWRFYFVNSIMITPADISKIK